MECEVCGVQTPSEHSFSLAPNWDHFGNMFLDNMLQNIAKCIFCALFISVLRQFHPVVFERSGSWVRIMWTGGHDHSVYGEKEGIVRVEAGWYMFARPPENLPAIVEIYGFHEDFLRWPNDTETVTSVKELPPSPDSNSTWGFVHSHVNECISQHNDTCSLHGLQRLPKRVVRIMSVEPWTISLHESMPGELGSYTTLSYCWGGADFLKTEPETFDDMKSEIPWGSLPVLFRDAIRVTHELGFEYIWIDALCIIQGNHSDWSIEASKMAEYYGHADLTIVADRSFNPHESILNVSRENWIGRDFNVPNRSEVVKVRQNRGHKPFTTRDCVVHRGWAWQERALSTRLLHYAERDVTFECQAIEEITEDGLSPVERKQVGINYPLQNQNINPDLLWGMTLSSYSIRNLTRNNDRLPAIAGFAKRIGAIKKCEYFAGLWEDELLENLLWTTGWTPQIFSIGSLSPPRVIPNPSWSWASLSGQIVNENFHKGAVGWDGYLHHMATILEKGCKYPENSPDVFGEVIEGFITIRGPAEELSLVVRDGFYHLNFGSSRNPALVLIDTVVEERETNSTDGERKTTARRKQFLGEIQEDLDPINASVIALYVLQRDKSVSGLLLGFDDAFKNTYERIGVFDFDENEAKDYNDHFYTLGQRTVTIV
ncbi:uncharacterized protein K452DRAFT_361274 [Aplosporella prunicola CBS 121167]|uniref:Heterokaryon incompatibility domain-containing protein n=1 Tax=Aplosporella prunicola CBS 121167 TaxID=1176127 RepID=A0A6A6B5C9_9PEZI|nr:uncharacterized protein K452DRAFT_361274 [Aplosporella prunicola CBS 121167]KAF2138623.1 hypothetical protein K452DRAFT_361274 [Aplosporella prunicola CBS 121167]